MARLFDDGSSQYLQNLNAPVNNWPITISCWIYIDDLTNEQAFVCICDKDAANNRIWVSVDAASFIRVYCDVGVAAYSGQSINVNTWYHVCGVWASNVSRTAYLNGVAGAENANAGSVTTANWDNVAIGMIRASSPEFPTSGRICEAAIWNVALTAAEVAILAKGYSPLFVHPQNLVCYWPLIRDEDQDRVGGYDMTPTNSPTIATHPPSVRYAAPLYVIIPPAAAIGYAANPVRFPPFSPLRGRL